MMDRVIRNIVGGSDKVVLTDRLFFLLILIVLRRQGQPIERIQSKETRLYGMLQVFKKMRSIKLCNLVVGHCKL